MRTGRVFPHHSAASSEKVMDAAEQSGSKRLEAKGEPKRIEGKRKDGTSPSLGK